MAPTNIDGTEITGATIDGQDVSEITVDGETVFTAIPDSYTSQTYSGPDVIEEEFGFEMSGASYGEIDWDNPGTGRNTTVFLDVRINGFFTEVGSVNIRDESSATGTETFSFSAVDADAARATINDNKIDPTQFRIATDSSEL